jgi:hypothetical protein
MTNYTAQVELHQAGADDYQQLIRAMKRELFVTGNDLQTSGNLTFKRKASIEIKEVIEAVLSAAASTGRKFSFTVMKDKQAEKKPARDRFAWR